MEYLDVFVILIFLFDLLGPAARLCVKLSSMVFQPQVERVETMA